MTSRRIRRSVAAALLGVVALGLAGCGAAAAEPASTAAPVTCQSLERCYTKGQLDQFLGQARALIQEFSAASYQGLPAPAYALIPTGASTAACGARIGDLSYLYCTADQTIYVGQEALWAIYSQDGDAAAVAGLAHEWGHHVQIASGVTAATLVKEVQADCIAGAWLGYEAKAGRLEPGDLNDVDRLIQRIASAETPDRDHGTLGERTAAFRYGLNNGLAGCNRFTPSTPVIT